MADVREVDVQLHWRTTPLARTLLICAAAAFARRGADLRPLAADRLRRPAVRCAVHGRLAAAGVADVGPVGTRSDAVFRGEEVSKRVELSAAATDGAAHTLSVSAPAGMRTEAVPDGSGASHRRRRRVALGPLPAVGPVDVVAPGTAGRDGSVDIADVFVFPRAHRRDVAAAFGHGRPTRHPPDPAHGPGVEFADIRPYVPR